MNRITIELCADDRARIDRLIAAMEGAGQPIVMAEEPAQREEQVEEPVKPAITLDMLRALAQELIAPGADQTKREKTREIVKGYAKSLSQIPQDKWSEVYDALTALKEE